MNAKRPPPSKVERTEGPFAQAPGVGRSPDGRGAAGRGFQGRTSQGGGGAAQDSGPAGAPMPFASYGPDAQAMAGQVAGSRSQSMGVMAILGGLAFMTASVLVVVVVVLIISFFVVNATRTEEEVAGADDDREIRDTGHADPTRSGGVGGRRAGDPGERTVGDGTGPGAPGPISLTVPNEMMFLSIEVNCPSGYRSRGRFKKINASSMTAGVRDVPSDETCEVTFQGSEPARTTISGNQRKICKFNPTECYLQ